MAEELPNTIPSYRVLKSSDMADTAGIQRRLRADGFDGAIVMRVVTVDERLTYTPGTYWYGAPYYSFNNYWGTAWGYPYDPGYVYANQVVTIETQIYSLTNDKLIWAGRSETTDLAHGRTAGAFRCGTRGTRAEKRWSARSHELLRKPPVRSGGPRITDVWGGALAAVLLVVTSAAHAQQPDTVTPHARRDRNEFDSRWLSLRLGAALVVDANGYGQSRTRRVTRGVGDLANAPARCVSRAGSRRRRHQVPAAVGLSRVGGREWSVQPRRADLHRHRSRRDDSRRRARARRPGPTERGHHRANDGAQSRQFRSPNAPHP